MNKIVRVIVLIVVVVFLFYSYFSKSYNFKKDFLTLSNGEESSDYDKPKVALIFDDLGESLVDIKNIYQLKIPLTIAVIPQLKFSKNIAHIAKRCNFSVITHLPLEPKDNLKYTTDKYTFISSDMPKRKAKSLLNSYLNYLRIAVGVNTHMGSAATVDPELMRLILKEIKRRDLIFIDSKTNLDSIAYSMADQMGIKAGYNHGFVDSQKSKSQIKDKLKALVEMAKELNKIIIIAHPRPNTIEVLKEKIPELKKQVNFITIEEYFSDTD